MSENFPHNSFEQNVILPSLLEEREIILQKLDYLYKEAPDRRKAILAKYKLGELDLEGYQFQMTECEAPLKLLQQESRQKEKEIRNQYIDVLNEEYPADEKRVAVEEIFSNGLPQDRLGKNIQEGGSNAMGVYPLNDSNLVVIEKSAGTYEFIGGLPAKLQALPESRRIPRVLSVFVSNEKTYQVVEKASGIQVDKMAPKEIAEIPQEHFNFLVKDIKKLNENGLYIDPSKNSNVFYDATIGFILIDLGYNDPFQEAATSQVNESDLRAFLMGGDTQHPEVLEKIKYAILHI